jgi:pimeloyl-ACP methyl ester carboxylesterase
MTSATVVLVHGAWHGAWCWSEVQRRLDDAGIANIAVDNPSVSDSAATLYDDADNVRATLDRIDGPVLLVGHSYGGAVITDAGSHPAVRHLVYLTAFALDDGETIMENDLVGGVGSALEAAVRIDEAVTTLDPALAVPALYHDCDAKTQQDAVSQLRPQSLASFGCPPRAAAWREKPSTYVVCSDDQGVPLALQRSIAARCTSVVELDASHSPFLSTPERLAALLVELSR